MCKSLLMIDKPETCENCPMFVSIGRFGFCRAKGNEPFDYDGNIPDWCPLVDVPEFEASVDSAKLEGYYNKLRKAVQNI